MKTRSIKQFGITTTPNMAFVQNQLKGFMYDRCGETTWLVHDNSGELKWTDYEKLGISDVAITPHSPNMNAFAERFIGSIRREILNKMLIFSRRQLHTVISEYVSWYNTHRPHQGIGNQCPNRAPPQAHGEIHSEPVLFGLYHNYYRKAG
ncbi:integrase core domain-containing protein [Spirochaeta dissipatitropha]